MSQYLYQMTVNLDFCLESNMTVFSHNMFSGRLDKMIRPKIRVFRRHWPAFQVCGCIGLALAILLAIVLIIQLNLSILVMTALAPAAVATFFVLVIVTKIISGEEKIIYYHHEIAVIVICAIVLWLLQKPILPYLDVTIAGIGVFLACGRIGCLMVGCCHGRPHRWGICYRHEHAGVVFTPYYVGVRLFPIQALESIYVMCIVVVGIAFILSGYPSGTTLGWYVIAYDLGRFNFEFLRGDPDRPYYWGFSQPQWISLFLMLFIVWAEFTGLLPFHRWHIGATVLLLITMISLGLWRRFDYSLKPQLLHPHHIREVVQAIESVSDLGTKTRTLTEGNSSPTVINVGCTSLGIKISAGVIEDNSGEIRHYTFSSRDRTMTEKSANALTDLILLLKHNSSSYELIKRDHSVFHLLVRVKRNIMREDPSQSVKSTYQLIDSARI